MLKQNLKQQRLIFHKIHFTLRKKVKFGQAIYVCGSTPEFGLWNPARAFRLKWNEGHVWTGIVLWTNHIPLSIQYKYVVADWHQPTANTCEWQIGDHNRRAALNPNKPITICDDKWNLDHIFLVMMARRPKSSKDERYYVAGDLAQLGGWQQKKTMKKTLNNIISCQIRNQLQLASQNIGKEFQFWTYSFEVFRNKTQFYYYYIKKGEIIEFQRKPGRIFDFKNQEKVYPNRRKVMYMRGDIVIVDQINLNEINISEITPKIYVGSCLKSAADLQKLKLHHITSIMSIQTEEDLKKNGISSHYLKIICQQNDIKYKRCSIEDMNDKEFVCKAEIGVNIMEELLSSGQTVYVHCSAGIYRSPQMIALYLIHRQNYKLQEAVELLINRHPYARPSFKVVEQALKIMQSKKRQIKI